MMDLAGLDIGWKEEESSSSTVREILCENGRRGQKNGRGYYTYDPDTRAATPDPEVEQLIKDFAVGKGHEQREVSDQEILERLLYPMVNEGAKILEEKIAIRGSDIDVVWVNGYGWPVYRGGPMHWADSVGLAEIVDEDRGVQRVARWPALGAQPAAEVARRVGRPAPDLHGLNRRRRAVLVNVIRRFDAPERVHENAGSGVGGVERNEPPPGRGFVDAVVSTGVDPVTSHFSGERSAN